MRGSGDELKLAALLVATMLPIGALLWNYGYEVGKCEARGGIYVKHHFKMKCLKGNPK